MKSLGISLRIRRILLAFIICLFLLLVKILYLGTVQKQYYTKEAQKNRMRTVIEKPSRATIADRFGIPLAVNASQFDASICYGEIRQIPSIKWEKDERGKKKKVRARKNYISEFSHFLGTQLQLNPQEVEDMIHGKASLFPHTPFVIKEDISENQYYRLKGLSRNWPGLHLSQTGRRVYPHGKLACDILGYLGAISPSEYNHIAEEILKLKEYLQQRSIGQAVLLPDGFSNPEEVEARLLDLEDKAYTINDLIGKTGIEATFDEFLRGAIGKTFYEVDIQGNILRKLDDSYPSKPGQRVKLSLSAELQEEAEKLLSEYEYLQDLRDQSAKKIRRHPWQRGGAIVAMDPHTGEVLAMASYPRFDPNDLIPMQTKEKRREKREHVHHWLESLSYIGEIWDGKRPMEREIYRDGKYHTQSIWIDWQKYLEIIIDDTSAVWKILQTIDTIEDRLALDDSALEELQSERDRDLICDLLEIAIPTQGIPSTLYQPIHTLSITQFHSLRQLASCALSDIQTKERLRFRNEDFQKWREEYFTQFLKQKRKLEKAKGRYTKPYIEYLEKEEERQFTNHWQMCRDKKLLEAIESQEQLSSLKEIVQRFAQADQLLFLRCLKGFDELTKPLKGRYPLLRSEKGGQLQKHLAAAFYPYGGFGLGRSQAFRQATPIGSCFKVITAYTGLKQQYDLGFEDLNPLTLIDDMQWTPKPGSNSQVLGYFKNGQPIQRLYKGGRLPRGYPKIGELDVAKALERTSNIYFSLLAGDVLDTPSKLIEAAHSFGLGKKTGIDLPYEYKGQLPDDILHNKTGLYSFAIGQHSLVATPLQAAVAFSAIANGGTILKPQITYSAQKTVDHITLPNSIQEILLEGMSRVINGEKGTARSSLIRSAFHNKQALKAYRSLQSQLVGKTGTAEIMYKQTIDAESEAQLEKHVWFSSIGFEDETLETPELVVIVYSRFGSAGKQGAPIAARMLEKWREIKEKHYNKKI